MSQRRNNLKLKAVVSYMAPQNYIKNINTSNNLSASSRCNIRINPKYLSQNFNILDQKHKILNNVSYINNNIRSTSKKSIILYYYNK